MDIETGLKHQGQPSSCRHQSLDVYILDPCEKYGRDLYRFRRITCDRRPFQELLQNVYLYFRLSANVLYREDMSGLSRIRMFTDLIPLNPVALQRKATDPPPHPWENQREESSFVYKQSQENLIGSFDPDRYSGTSGPEADNRSLWR